MKFNERLKMVRKENRLTQGELAERAGISVNSVRLYESGKVIPKIGTIIKIADVFGMSLNDFMLDDSYSEESIDERIFFAEREIASRIRRSIKFERHKNPDSKIDNQLIKEWIFDLVPDISKKYALPEETLKNASDKLAWLATDIHLTTEIDDFPDPPGK